MTVRHLYSGSEPALRHTHRFVAMDYDIEEDFTVLRQVIRHNDASADPMMYSIAFRLDDPIDVDQVVRYGTWAKVELEDIWQEEAHY